MPEEPGALLLDVALISRVSSVLLKGWKGRGGSCHGSDGKVPDSAVMTTRAGSILVMDYS
jgi:hypothetical protein